MLILFKIIATHIILEIMIPDEVTDKYDTQIAYGVPDNGSQLRPLFLGQFGLYIRAIAIKPAI